MSYLKLTTHLVLTCFFLFTPVYQLTVVKPNRENIPFKTILSIDGGGVRAAIPISIIVELENKIKSSMVENAELLITNGVLQESDLGTLQQGTDAFTIYLADFFDLAAGVSAGSIVTAYLASRGESVPKEYNAPRGSAAAGLELFTEYAAQIFEPSFFRQGLTNSLYPAEGIDNALKEIFGEDTLISSIENITYLVTSYELENSRAFFMYDDAVLGRGGMIGLQPTVTAANEIPNIEKPDYSILNSEDFYLWESVRCSAAAPTYLPSHVFRSASGHYEGTCIDGAVIANNPDQFSLVYITSAQDVYPEEVAILSLGQGVLVQDLANGRSLDRGITGWATDLITIFTDGGMETQEIMMDTLFYTNLGVRAPQYLRIQLRSRLDDNSKGLPGLDDVEAIPDLVLTGKDLAQLYDEYLDQFVARFLLGTEEQPPPRY